MRFISWLQQMRVVCFKFFYEFWRHMRLCFIMFLVTLFLLVLSYRFITLFIWFYILCKAVQCYKYLAYDISFFLLLNWIKEGSFCFVKKSVCFLKKIKFAFWINLFQRRFFFLSGFSFTTTNHRTAGEAGGHFFNSPLPLPPTSQTRRH